uniref:Uncharacterized protein n=1 Tax=Knipowitschia caucasica TaxID=637954 RepID=A0AAV2J9S8_KNICA
MHSLAISEKHDDDLEAANDLQNSMIEMEEAVCWEDDDSDEDYVPFLYLRSTGASKAEIDKLHEIHIDEAVLDVEEVPIVPEEDQHIPVRHKVETVEDLVGKEASICYNDNLLSLARYMQLPTEVVVLGDGRMDSPGHCAQFCTYTMIEHETRDIVHISSLRYCGMEYYIMYAMNTHGPQGSVSMSHWMTAVKISRGYSKVLLLIRP